MNNDINNLLDQLVLKTQDKNSFNQLSPEQRAIGALELLIGTATRSGVEVFFNEENASLYNDVDYGLKLINETEGHEIFNSVISDGDVSINKTDVIRQLQNHIVQNNFNRIYQSIRTYVNENFNQLSKNILL